MEEKDKITQKLNVAADKMRRYVYEILMSREDVNKGLLNEFGDVLVEYQKNGDTQILYKLIEIDSRPVPEGADTDFTTGMSLPLDGEYTSLMELINEIQDLVSEIRSL